jgi:hypothetical protein
VLGGDPGDEDASDFILAGAREGELVATDSIGVVVPTRIMADCHDIAAKFEGWQAEATIVRVCDDSREIALFETKTAETVPSYFHRISFIEADYNLKGLLSHFFTGAA